MDTPRVMRVAVIGGHGKVALLLAPLLVAAGDEVTALYRDPAHTVDVEATGAHGVVADVETLGVQELAALLAGHDAVVWSAGAGGGSPARTYAVDRDAAIRSMDAADTYLRASTLDWTVLGPSRLTSNPATGAIETGTASGSVTRADVAAVVAATLRDDSTVRRTIAFNNGDDPIADALRPTG
jgi:uncharacterized protein YbjT (DUF2867 family)